MLETRACLKSSISHFILLWWQANDFDKGNAGDGIQETEVVKREEKARKSKIQLWKRTSWRHKVSKLGVSECVGWVHFENTLWKRHTLTNCCSFYENENVQWHCRRHWLCFFFRNSSRRLTFLLMSDGLFFFKITLALVSKPDASSQEKWKIVCDWKKLSKGRIGTLPV